MSSRIRRPQRSRSLRSDEILKYAVGFYGRAVVMRRLEIRSEELDALLDGSVILIGKEKERLAIWEAMALVSKS